MPLNEDEKAELVAYLDGELDEAATQAMEARIATDADARAELDALKQTWGMLDYLPKTSPSPNFTNRTMERLSLERVRTKPASTRRWPWAIGWAAAILLTASVGFVASRHLWPAPVVPDPIPDSDMPLIQHLSVVENWRLYENAEDIEFVKKLNQPDYFGEDMN